MYIYCSLENSIHVNYITALWQKKHVRFLVICFFFFFLKKDCNKMISSNVVLHFSLAEESRLSIHSTELEGKEKSRLQISIQV